MFADGAHLCVSYLYSYCSSDCLTSQSYLRCLLLINVVLTVDVYECCLIVSNTATILFVNVPLGSSGDTQQSVFIHYNHLKKGCAQWEYSVANRIHNVSN